MSFHDVPFFCHFGAARRAEPRIQMEMPNLLLDSGFALSARPGMTPRGAA